MLTQKKSTSFNLEFWGGIECTINRVQDTFFDQLNISGHYNRPEDLQLIAGLGIKKLRYPVLWERHKVNSNGFIDWFFTAQQLDELRKNKITPIAGLLHHGSGFAFTSLPDDNFLELFSEYARKVAQRFPWLQYYTPINEPLTTPPDVMGFNYYVTSERYLDENIARYPGYSVGGNNVHRYVDVEAIRVNHENPGGLKILLHEAWERLWRLLKLI